MLFSFAFKIILLVMTNAVAHATSSVQVVNNCPYQIQVQSVQRDTQVKILSPGETYSEIYRPAACYNNDPVNCTGVSIKISKSIRQAPTAITQLEYTFTPGKLPDLWYDISDINDNIPRQFCEHGYSLYTHNRNCPDILCNIGCDYNCPSVYNHPSDDWATHGCTSDSPLQFVVCSNLL